MEVVVSVGGPLFFDFLFLSGRCTPAFGHKAWDPSDLLALRACWQVGK